MKEGIWEKNKGAKEAPRSRMLVGLKEGREAGSALMELSPRGERPGGRGRGSGPRAGGDRWVDTKRRASGETDGWGREDERLVGGQWSEEAVMRLEMGWSWGEVSGEERRKERPP